MAEKRAGRHFLAEYLTSGEMLHRIGEAPKPLPAPHGNVIPRSSPFSSFLRKYTKADACGDDARAVVPFAKEPRGAN